jgi:Cu/Ag efflux pump CusA
MLAPQKGTFAVSWIIGLSCRFRFLVVAISAGVLVIGFTQLRTMPIDALPEFAPTSVEVQTEALGLSAQEVEQLITVPLEQDLLNGVPWLAEMRSESLPGLSSVVMTFDPGTDELRARQVVGERLTQAFALPHVSKPPTMLQPSSTSDRVMMVGLTAADMSLIDLSTLARWTIAPRLMGVPGVASVSIWGQRDRQLQVQVDPERLQARNVTLLQVLETTGNAMWVSSLSFVEASTPGTGGFIDTANQRLGIRHVFPISSPEGLAQVPIQDATSLRLGDVANVVEDHQPLIGDAVADSPSLLLVVEKAPGVNTLEVTDGLDKAISAMRPGLAGVAINSSVYRPATFIDMAIANLGRALLIGGVLVLLTLGVFLFNWRAALICAVVVPLSLTAGALALYVRGATLNVVVLAGFLVALGLVIDDAVANVDSTREVRTPLLYATLILALALLPAWFVDGLPGALLRPMAESYALAVLASLLVALLVTPGLSLIVFGRGSQTRDTSPLVGWLEAGYARALAPVVRDPRVGLFGLAAAAVASVLALGFVKPSLVPTFKEPDLLIHLDGAPGTSQPEMHRIVARMSDELHGVAGVENVGAHVGRALLSDRVVNVNSSELWVSIDPAAPYATTVEAVRRVVDGYPGLHHQVSSYLQEQTTAASADNGPLTVRVFGEDPATLRSTAEDVQRALADTSGVVGQHLVLPSRQPTLDIEVDLAAAQRYGLTPGDIRRAAATVLSGIQAGSLFEEQKVFDVIVVGTPEARNSLSSIQGMLLDTPGGGHVRLGDVAQAHVVPALSVIRHQDVRSYLDIRLDVQGRAIDAVSDDVGARLRGMQFPLEYHAEVLGDYAAHEAARSRLLGVAIAVALGMLLLLQAAVGSWRFASLALVLVGSALVGGLLAILASGGVLTLGGLAGLAAVFGVALRNVIVLAKHYQQVAVDEGPALGAELMLRCARARLGPTLATALATALAMTPFIVGGDVAGFELARPLAIVAVCGLVTSTLLNLFVSPALCLLCSKRSLGVVAPAPVLSVAAPAANPAD